MLESAGNLLEMTTAQFLGDVRQRVPVRFSSIDFDEIVLRISEWSSSSERSLQPREAEDQNRVSFGLAENAIVLWAAYPRNVDGAGIVVLPRIFRRLSQGAQDSLLGRLAVVAPQMRLSRTGLLQLPMHLLAPTRALDGFLDLLGEAYQNAADYYNTV